MLVLTPDEIKELTGKVQDPSLGAVYRHLEDAMPSVLILLSHWILSKIYPGASKEAAEYLAAVFGIVLFCGVVIPMIVWFGA